MTPAQQRAYDHGWELWGIDYLPEPMDLRNVFGDSKRFILEIGFGMGGSLLEMARNDPESAYLGIEVHRPGVGRLLMGISELGVTNLRIMCHDAVEVLERCITPGTLDAIQIFFPDPWPKKRHHKRRLVQRPFVRLAADRLRSGGRLHLATDWQPYAEHMLQVLEDEKSLRNAHGKNRYAPRPQDRPLTKFEARGRGLGHGVWDLVFERAAPPPTTS